MSISYTMPSALFDAVEAGTVAYDAHQEGICLEELLNENCFAYELFENLPACAGVFTCADGGSTGSGDGAGADGDAGCAALLPSAAALVACHTGGDCSGVTFPETTPTPLQGPYCVDGYCARTPCGLLPFDCDALSQAGQPCDAIMNMLLPWAATPTSTGTCAPGLVCQPVSDGGPSICVTPEDVGGPCTPSAAFSGAPTCKLGLVCACGVCQIAPGKGPCVNNLCDPGIAYCDFTSNTCKPVAQGNDDCAGLAVNACASDLVCTASTCQSPPTP